MNTLRSLRAARKLLLAAIVTITSAVGWLYARHALATNFHVYDDEGYVLLSLDHYLAGGHLYTEVFSQYGPLYFFVEGSLFRLLGLPIDHDAGRLVTLILWLASAVLAGYFVYRVSRNVILASAAGLGSVLLARVLAYEPGHPQQVILLILLASCCASTYSGRAGLVLLGALGAALLFTKINIGVFYIAALALTLVWGLPAGRLRTLSGWFLLVYAAGIPFLLMRRDLLKWAAGYCLLALLCSVSTFAVALLTPPSSPNQVSSVLYAIGGMLATACAIVTITLLQGMSLNTLLDGVLWAPLRLPGIFELPLPVPRWRMLIALLAFGGIGLLFWFRDRWRPHADAFDALRCIIGLCAIAILTTRHSPSLVMDFLPLELIPISGSAQRRASLFPRVFVTSLAATQFLQAYPVAGSQQSIGATPLLLWAFLCVHDGAYGLFNLVRRTTVLRGDLPKDAILGGFLVLGLATGMVYSGGLLRRVSAEASSLNGAASLRLPPETENLFQFIARNVHANCNVLFTMPGMGSLNFWSAVPTPNGLNLTAWMRGLSLEEQQRILSILQETPQACAVYNEDLTRFWQVTPKELGDLPLARYILHDMRPVAQAGGYQIRVHPRRLTPWKAVALLSP